MCSCALFVAASRIFLLFYFLQMVMKFQDVEQISKEKTVKVFPNAIQIRMKGCYKSPTFTSFTQRDRVFVLLCKLWQNSRKEKVSFKKRKSYFAKPARSKTLITHPRSEWSSERSYKPLVLRIAVVFV